MWIVAPWTAAAAPTRRAPAATASCRVCATASLTCLRAPRAPPWAAAAAPAMLRWARRHQPRNVPRRALFAGSGTPLDACSTLAKPLTLPLPPTPTVRHPQRTLRRRQVQRCHRKLLCIPQDRWHCVPPRRWVVRCCRVMVSDAALGKCFCEPRQALCFVPCGDVAASGQTTAGAT
jgi:hypothetical protein